MSIFACGSSKVVSREYPGYPPAKIAESTKDTILFRGSLGSPFDPVKVFYNGEHVGTLQKKSEWPQDLIFLYASGFELIVWHYVDYDTITKVSQSQSGEIIRVYSSGDIFRNGDLVTELKLNAKEIKKYSLSQN